MPALKLTDTQLVLLSAAAQRDDRRVELPTNQKRGAAQKAAYQLAASEPSENQREMLRRLELPFEAHEALQKRARSRRIDFLSTPFDLASPEFLARDLKLPRIDGLEVLRRIRQFSDVPVIMVTVRDDEISKVTGLEEHPYESQHLRKSAIVTVTRRLAPGDVAGEQTFLTCELVNQDAVSWVYFLAGSPSELDPVLERLEKEHIVKDIVYSKEKGMTVTSLSPQQVGAFQEKMTPVWDSFADKIGKDLIQKIKDTK